MSKESAKKWHQRNRDKRLEMMKSRYEKERKVVFSKLGDACACCGETEPLFLTVDHVNNDGHIQRKDHRNQYTRIYRWLIKNNFPKGFQLLCMNCNQGKHRNGGVCPHLEGSTTRAEARRAKRPEAPGAVQ